MTRSFKVALLFLGGLILASLSVGFFSHTDPNAFNVYALSDYAPPSWDHWFGTDDLGRDLLIRALYGARISLLVGTISVTLSVLIGVAVGLVSGYFSGWVDSLCMRLVDIFMAIPTLFLLLTIQVMIKPSIWNVMIVIGLTSWMGMARLVRAEVKSVKERPFILAARSRGVSTGVLLFKHILPHTLNPVIVSAMLGVGDAILTESMLSFLGLGVQPPHASWGNMLDNSLAYMRVAPWMAIFPGLLITFTVLSLNFIGDGLRQKLDVKGRV